MKKLIAAILCAALMLGASACGNDSESKTPAGDGRTELIVAADLSGAYLSAMVREFNESSESYKVKLRYYGKSKDYTLTNLQTEIIAGSAPDIYAFSQDPLPDADVQIYEDLLPYLDADEEYSRDSFVAGLINALSSPGRLDYIPCEFYIHTFSAPLSVVGERVSITLSEARKYAEENGVSLFPDWFDRRNLLANIIVFSRSRFVDYAAGTCDFESPEFIALLTMCSQHVPREPDEEERPCLLDNMMIQTFDYGFISLHRRYGTEWSCVGFPNDEGCGSSFGIKRRFSISVTSEHKEAAWEFVRLCLDEENQSRVEYLPVTREVFDKRAAEQLREEGEENESKLEPFELERFLRLVDSITMVNERRDGQIGNIIAEGAAPFFAGDKSAAEAAAVIQSRASLYLAERYG